MTLTTLNIKQSVLGREQEEIGMAVSALVKLSEDKVTRQAYQKRQDEIMLYNNRINALTRRAETAEAEIERLLRENEELKAKKTT